MNAFFEKVFGHAEARRGRDAEGVSRGAAEARREAEVA